MQGRLLESVQIVTLCVDFVWNICYFPKYVPKSPSCIFTTCSVDTDQPTGLAWEVDPVQLFASPALNPLRRLPGIRQSHFLDFGANLMSTSQDRVSAKSSGSAEPAKTYYISLCIFVAINCFSIYYCCFILQTCDC